MRLGGRLAAAIEILDDMDRRHRPASEALRDWGVSHRFAGAGDRAAIGNIVYDALRRRRSAAWLLDDGSARALAFGAILLEWDMDAEAVAQALAGDRFAPPGLDEDERRALLGRDLASAPPAVRADCPDWCVPHFEAAFGADWAEEAAALSRRPPLDLRVNTLIAGRDKVLGEMSRVGAGPARLAPNGLRVPPVAGGGRHPNVQAEPAFRKGWFEVQDEGSQLAVELARPEPGTQVLDFCAGAGGKTLAMAATMGNRGQVFAFDADRHRLAPIFERLKRAATRNVQAFADPARLAALEGGMDLVLVDAPCTGTGTWRRRPDAKWRLSERQLDKRRAEQAAILADAARHVAPGGRLVYVTCSVLAAENEERVRDFLGAGHGFEPEDHAAVWEALAPGAGELARIGPLGISLTPRRTGTDGFFVSLMKRGGGTAATAAR